MHNWKKCTSATVLFIPLDLLINYYRVLISPLEPVIIADTEFCEISHKSAQPVLHNSRFHFPPQPCPASHYPPTSRKTSVVSNSSRHGNGQSAMRLWVLGSVLPLSLSLCVIVLFCCWLRKICVQDEAFEIGKEMYRGQQYSQIYFARLHLMRTLLYSLVSHWKPNFPGTLHISAPNSPFPIIINLGFLFKSILTL